MLSQISWPTVVLCVVIVLCILAIHQVSTRYPRAAAPQAQSWAELYSRVKPYLPGNPKPSYADYHYVSAVDLVTVINTPKYSIVAVSRGGIITHTTLNIEGYITLGDIMLEGNRVVDYEPDGVYRFVDMKAYSFKRSPRRSLHTQIHTVSWDA